MSKNRNSQNQKIQISYEGNANRHSNSTNSLVFKPKLILPVWLSLFDHE